VQSLGPPILSRGLDDHILQEATDALETPQNDAVALVAQGLLAVLQVISEAFIDLLTQAPDTPCQ